LVRSLKATNPKGDEAKAAIAKLLELKAQYKSVTGNEYKPKPVEKAPLVESGTSEESPDELRKQIEEQGNLQESKDAIAKLLELKKTFKD
uniref:Bifunctional glutamate/proline--tRNA ligase (inferred by orthology to a D. melanogaster protein) n=1 Tax=Anisakis simplex TaxID=6269 RepID=A0A0M3KKL0_ANISI